MWKEKFKLPKLDKEQTSDLRIAVSLRIIKPKPEVKGCSLCKKYKSTQRHKTVLCEAKCPANVMFRIHRRVQERSAMSNGFMQYDSTICGHYAALYAKKKTRQQAINFINEVDMQLRLKEKA